MEKSKLGRKKDQSRIAVNHRRTEVAKLYLQGLYQSEIANIFDVTQAQISKDLAIIRQEWLTSRAQDYDEKIAEELAKIDAVEAEYWQAWMKSKEIRTLKRTKSKGTRESQEVGIIETEYEEVTNEHGGVGDPRFLDGIQKCIERRCKLLGLDAPQKHEVKGEGFNVIILPANGRA